MSEFILNLSTKKELFEIYNQVNKEIYGYGTTELKIHFVDSMIVFSVHHKRVPCLLAIEEEYRTVKENADAAIMKVFKKELKKRLTGQLGLDVQCVLRDYDYASLTAVTVVMLGDCAMSRSDL